MSKEYWILREGDLLPESTKEYKFIGKYFLDELKKDGLLFESIEEARQVADVLRSAVKSLRSEQCECIHTPFEGLAVGSHQDQPCASHQCRYNNSHSHKREHTLQISHGLDNEKTEGTFPKIEIAIHL
jgi:hypothetical protein